jgi:type II restriction enzyme
MPGTGALILLHKIPQDARIPIVAAGAARPAAEVRRAYKRLRPLEKIKAEKRGWTLEVRSVVQALGKMEFTLADVYGHAGALAKRHPNNRHVRDKIRQQLQVLRDLGLVEFLGRGSYTVR